MIGRAAPWDVAVVGAGPAGCAAAYHLGRRGRRVLLLDRSRFPRDKACGDGLTTTSVKLLVEMGLTEALGSPQKARGIRVRTKDHGQRDFLYRKNGCQPEHQGIVIPRYELDYLLTRRALDVGVTLWERSSVVDLVQDGGRLTRLRVAGGASPADVSARLVVLADGAASGLRARVGLGPADHWSIGFAVRGYYRLHHEVPDLFEVHVPLVDPLDGGIAGYGWVFPVSPTRANIGVGFFPTASTGMSLNVRELFARFLDDLARSDARFAGMTLDGRLRGGQLASGFDPDACQGRDVLLVGDAARLVDPFTGEGINGALESGKLAAEVLDRALSKPLGYSGDLREYGQCLNERFGEHFRVGHRLVKTYGFMWKVLEETFHVDSPLFDGLRRATLDFGMGPLELSALPIGAGDLVERLELRPDFEAVARRLRLVLRSENPIFSKIARRILDGHGSFVRLALLHLCRRFGSVDDPETAAATAAAIELSQLALDVQHDVLDETEPRSDTLPRPVGWANRFALTAADWLLVQAYKLLAELDGELTRAVSRACARVCCGILEGVTQARREHPAYENLRVAGMTTGAIFELCCTVGTRLGRGQVQDLATLATFGRPLGVAHRLSREAHDLSVQATDLRAHPVAHALRRQSLPFPVAWTLEQRPDDGLADLLAAPIDDEEKVERSLRILRANGSIGETRREARAHHEQAVRALDEVPAGPRRAALIELAGAVLTP